jgi:hypothetical protein
MKIHSLKANNLSLIAQSSDQQSLEKCFQYDLIEIGLFNPTYSLQN